MKISEILGDDSKEKEYVNIDLERKGDNEKYRAIHPYKILGMENIEDKFYELKIQLEKRIISYFSKMLKSIRCEERGTKSSTLEELSRLGVEGDFIKLGYSKKGYGFGLDYKRRYDRIIESIRNSEAYNSGYVSDIIDLQIFVDDIGVDKISDLIVNLSYDIFSEYTMKIIKNYRKDNLLVEEKCNIWNGEKVEEKYIQVIKYGEAKLLLVPKELVISDSDIVHKFSKKTFKEGYEKFFETEEGKKFLKKHKVDSSKSVWEVLLLGVIGKDKDIKDYISEKGRIRKKGFLALMELDVIFKETYNSKKEVKAWNEIIGKR